MGILLILSLEFLTSHPLGIYLEISQLDCWSKKLIQHEFEPNLQNLWNLLGNHSKSSKEMELEVDWKLSSAPGMERDWWKCQLLGILQWHYIRTGMMQLFISLLQVPSPPPSTKTHCIISHVMSTQSPYLPLFNTLRLHFLANLVTFLKPVSYGSLCTTHSP